MKNLTERSYDPNSLTHHGINGMRWGIRRYQNKDGTLTEEGKIHYAKSNGNNEISRKEKDPKPESASWRPEDYRILDDAELNRRISRLQREKQYRDMTSPQWEKELKQTTKDWIKESGKKIFISTAVSLAAVGMRNRYSSFVSHFFDINLAHLRP